jgi:general secretion pathway protein K
MTRHGVPAWRRRPTKALGAAMLTALLTVSLVAIFASQAAWQQWRSLEVETADRSRLQAGWLLAGTLDWARARLREDALNSGPVDHAGEPWAQAVLDMPLTDLGMAAPQSLDGAEPAVRWSQQLSDAQGKLNVLNLVDGQRVSPTWLRAFEKLFEVMQLPPEQLAVLSFQLLQAQAALGAPGSGGDAALASAPLLPQHITQLVWLGLTPQTLDALAPHITLLPARSPINLNSASAEVLQAVLPEFSAADARALIAQRQRQPLQSVTELGDRTARGEGQYSVSSRFFEMYTEVRQGPYSMAENALLQRDGPEVRTLWRQPVAPRVRPAPQAQAAPA